MHRVAISNEPRQKVLPEIQAIAPECSDLGISGSVPHRPRVEEIEPSIRHKRQAVEFILVPDAEVLSQLSERWLLHEIEDPSFRVREHHAVFLRHFRGGTGYRGDGDAGTRLQVLAVHRLEIEIDDRG